MIEIFLGKKTKSKGLKCLFKKGEEFLLALPFPKVCTGISWGGEHGTHTSAQLLETGHSSWESAVEQVPIWHLPTLYLSIGSSCCSWLSRIVWYSLSYFFSFFVGTCGIDLGNMHLKIRGTLEKLTESSPYKEETEEVLESCC